MTDFKSQFDYEDLRTLELKKKWPTVFPELGPSLGEPSDVLKRVSNLVEEVFEKIDRFREEEIAFLQKIVRTKSVNPSPEYEKPLAEVLKKDLTDLGMEVESIETAENRVSVSSVLKGSGMDRTLIFSATWIQSQRDLLRIG